MKTLTCYAALCAALAMSGAVQAQTAFEDPLYQGRVLEFSLGLFAPFNSLQDTLTTPNGGGAQVQSTDQLDFGPGGRLDAAYSQPWGSNSRLIVNLTGATATGDETITIGGAIETFPGSYDDGYNLPAGWDIDPEVKTETLMLAVGREWMLDDQWRVSAGLKAGQASQDLMTNILDPGGVVVSTQTTQSNNQMIGVFGGISHYAAIDDNLGLRLSGMVGVMQNDFDYQYTSVRPGGIVDQDITASESGTAISTQLSVRLERSLSKGGMLTFELGFENLQGIGNGVDTFLDVAGTATTAQIGSDSIGGGYLSVGYAFQF